MLIDMDAIEKWNAISKDNQRLLLGNVYCKNCHSSTTIVDYDIHLHEIGILLEGKCKSCGGSVARVIEDC